MPSKAIGWSRITRRDVFVATTRPQLLILTIAFITVMMAPGILNGFKPLFAADILGWEKDSFTSWTSQAQLLAGLPAALLFGFAAAHWGARRMYVIGAVLTGLCALGMLALQAQWANPVIFIAMIFVTEILRALRLVAGGALAMRLCTPAIAATQFAVFMAILNLGSVIGGFALGWFDAMGGMPAMLIGAALCSFVGAGLAYGAKVGR
ncbi:MAG: MFS transporter [Sphingopyxis sp.]|nr:MFS transporter [Sphingopyxis sp.]